MEPIICQLQLYSETLRPGILENMPPSKYFRLPANAIQNMLDNFDVDLDSDDDLDELNGSDYEVDKADRQ